MNELFTSSLINCIYFIVIGAVIVYLILKFDKNQRKKLNKILEQTADVQPLFLAKDLSNKLHIVKSNLDSESRLLISKQLDELVADYDKGQISLPDYCNRLNRLLAMTA
ncbi:hypothetical protein [Mucilaginibacter segetis]|uniref:Uncharacterized protein n=1 Tax=Mucilaginibacter segetis TaxID=2793071 RepID=A0A934ULX6_9SPHI|nr:hypothetical protein [Mucilaginibacter segetis]MBK0378292.1 hypothetical protein [Mucilaginibacter segetis]